jgi:hypothetical protein
MHRNVSGPVRALAKAAVVVTFVVAGICAIPAPAFAYNLTGGYAVPNGTGSPAVIGSEVWIDTKNPYIHVDTSAWNMLQRDTNPNAYMQVGWDYPVSLSQSYYFTEYNLTGNLGDAQYVKYGPAAAGSQDYKITDDSVRYYLMINGVSVQNVVKRDMSWYPDQVTLAGEIQRDDDRFPGGYNLHARWQTASYKRPDGTWWRLYVRSTTYGHGHTDIVSPPTSTTFSIWDDREPQ